MFSKEAALAIIELSQWFANEKLIEATESYETGDRSQYAEMVRIEGMIKVLTAESRRIKTGRND